MSAHTAGEWRIMRWETQYMGMPKIGVVASGSNIADIHIGHSKRMANANARLIAAAPDLLEVLEIVARHGHLSYCPVGNKFARPSTECECYVEQVVNVIAKAKGDAS